MPRGDKPKYTDKQASKTDPISERPGAPRDEAERPAGTAVDKDDSGDTKRRGSGFSPTARPAAAKKTAAPRKSDAKRSEQRSPPTASAGLAAQGRRPQMDDREQRIREIAYFLWEEEGFPHGRAEQHWAAAEAIVDGQDAERKNGEEDPEGEPLAK
jgi:hypothetical protein